LDNVKAVLFDVHGTLVYENHPTTEIELSDYLFSRGYEVSPHQVRAAWAYVAFIDYPRYGYKGWRSYFSRIFWRLGVKVDEETLMAVVNLLESRPYKLYSDAAQAVPKAKQNGFKTATVTTIARFQFEKALEPIKACFDFMMTGYEAGCDKSNPRMYMRLLEILNVEPSEAIVVGDNLELDVLIPGRLGIGSIFLNRQGRKEGSSVDASVYDLNEAMETIIKRVSKN